MNVKTIFLYEKIEKDVYVVQLNDFEQNINQICKINKTLYDLKKFSRVWFEMLIKFLLSLNYTSLNAKSNVFIKNQTLIIIYVDDLIITKFNLNVISILKRALNEWFEMSDLNFCTFYLDMMIFKNRNLRKLILDQSVYVEQMLRDHDMWNCK